MNSLLAVRRWLYPPGAWNPGYWGNIPYLLLLRCAAAAGVWLRFWVNSDESMPEWTNVALIVAILAAFFLHWRPSATYSRSLYAAIVLVDVGVVSVAYWSTGRVESDLFLFYALPIFTAAEYLGARWVFLAFLATTGAFAFVTFTIPVTAGPYALVSRFEVMARVFLPRETFYVGLSVIWALRLRRERDARGWSMARQNQMQTLLACKEKVDKIFRLEDALRIIVEHAARGLDLEFASGVMLPPVRPNPDSWADGGPPMSSAAFLEKSTGRTKEGIAASLEHCHRILNGNAAEGAFPVIVQGRLVGAIAAIGLGRRASETGKEYLESLAQLAGLAYERASLFPVVSEIGAAAAIAVEHNQHVESLLDELVGKIGFEYATISLVPPYKNSIQTMRGRNVPPGWIAASVHSLDGNDILAHIVRDGRVEVFDQFDSRFNFAIWKRYSHERLARVYAPIVAGEGEARKVIGVIEAGCEKSRRSALVDPNVETVRLLGEQWGERIARSVPSVLLKLIASRAITLIGAESASLHVFRDNEELVVACAGKVDDDFLRRFRPSPSGIGRQAMAQRRYVVENALPAEKRELYLLGIRAMAAFPLFLNERIQGVLYIHYWQPRMFSEAELELVQIFVPQMEVAIRNHLLMQDSSKLDESAWMVRGLQNLLQSLASEPKLNNLLKRLAADVQFMLDAKNVTLYQYFQEERRFSRAVIAGKFEQPEAMTMEVRDDNIVIKVVASGQNRWVTDAPSEDFLHQTLAGVASQPRFVEREGIQSTAILVLKSPYDGEIVGCLFANHVERKEFERQELKGYRQLAELLASSAALAIKAARLHARDLDLNRRDVDRREEELKALREIDKVIVAGAGEPDIDKVCEAILAGTLHVLGEDVTLGDVALWDAKQEVLRVRASKGHPDNSEFMLTKLGDGIEGWVAEHLQSLCVGDVSKDNRYRKGHGETRSELTVPIKSQENTLLGIINVEHKNRNAFTERDKAFLEMLALQATIALDIVRLYGKLQQKVQQALTLKTVATRIQDSEMDLAAALRLVLVGVTANDGLKFSRAMFFDTSEDGRELRGLVSIGATTQSRAEGLWSTVGGLNVNELLDRSLRVDSDQDYTISDADLDQQVRSIKMQWDALPAPIRQCLSDPARGVCRLKAGEIADSPFWPLYSGEAACPLAILPLRAGEKIVGLMILDNRFLDVQQSLDPETEPMLIAFADLALMTRLRASLADEKQLADWREASGRVAHVLQQQVLNIENRIRDLRVDLDDRDLNAARLRMNELELTIQDVNQRLDKIRRFGAPWKPELSTVDLVYVVRHTVDVRRRDFSARIHLDLPEAVFIKGDAESLPHMFLDLLFNADRALRSTPEPAIQIRCRVSAEEGSVALAFEDNGPGIPEEIREKLFEPYVTKSSGTGLGLPIIRKIVEAHKGDITCAPGENGTGACFLIRLPLAAKEAAAKV